MIFLMATDAPVSWSFAELNETHVGGWVVREEDVDDMRRTIRGQMHL